MAKGNGRMSDRSITEWFSSKDFDAQAALLVQLNAAHAKLRQEKIDALERQLALLKGTATASRRANGAAKLNGKRKAAVAAKYRNPKTGEAWSGRGRMARWLAEKVKAGEKADKYLA